MPIRTYTVINGEDVSRFVLSVKTDLKTSGDSSVQQADLVIANPAGRFDGAWSPQTPLFIFLISDEFDTDTHAETYAYLVFTGFCQKVDYGALEVSIKAGCDLKQTSSSIKWNILVNYGPTVEPVIKHIMEQWNLTEGVIEIAALKKRSFGFLGNIDARTPLDEVSMWDGKETYEDESNRLNHREMVSHDEFPILTGRMKKPDSSKSAIGYCNKVCIRCGSWISATDPGSEQPNLFTSEDSYETNDADLAIALGTPGTPATATAAAIPGVPDPAKAAEQIAKYGIIRAPDFNFPELTTKEECQDRAIRLLRMYAAVQNVALPAVIGRSPDLRDEVSWQFRKLYGMHGWLPTELQKGSVSRRIDEVNAKSGWVTYMEVQPNVLKGGTEKTDLNKNPEPPQTNGQYTSLANSSIYTDKDTGAQYNIKGSQWVVRDSKGESTNATPPRSVINLYNDVLNRGYKADNPQYISGPGWGH
jgi:hypothetical protein